MVAPLGGFRELAMPIVEFGGVRARICTFEETSVTAVDNLGLPDQPDHDEVK